MLYLVDLISILLYEIGIIIFILQVKKWAFEKLSDLAKVT